MKRLLGLATLAFGLWACNSGEFATASGPCLGVWAGAADSVRYTLTLQEVESAVTGTGNGASQGASTLPTGSFTVNGICSSTSVNLTFMFSGRQETFQGQPQGSSQLTGSLFFGNAQPVPITFSRD